MIRSIIFQFDNWIKIILNICVFCLSFYTNGQTWTAQSSGTSSVLLASCSITDSLALIDLYNSTNGANWTNKWNLNQPMSTWFGVEVNPQGCVCKIDLDGIPDFLPNATAPGNNLVGTLNFGSDTGSLRSICRMSFRNNTGITGSIPTILGRNMTKMVTLSLGFTNVSGTVPANFGNFTSMNYMELNNTLLSGPLPPEIGNLVTLQTVELNDNPNLGGALPNELGNLSSIVQIYAYNCNFSGSIPATLTNLPNLKVVNLQQNHFTGVVPDFGQNLTDLLVWGNDLTDLPDLTSITSWGSSSWQGLQIDGNQFTFEDILPNISIFNSNAPSNYFPQDSVFSDTVITRSTGQSLTIDLGFDAVVGSNIYAWKKNGIIYQTNTGNNKLVFNNLQLSDSGEYWVDISNPNAQANGFALHSRKITLQVNSGCTAMDSIELLKLYSATNGSSSWINKWNLAQPMNTWYGVTLNANRCVQQLTLADNGLSGTLPDMSLSELLLFNVGGSGLNNISGIIPNYANFPKCTYMSFASNEFTGSLPNLSMPELTELFFSVNNLNGNGVPNYSGLPKLEKLHFHSNQLTGIIPTFTNLPKLKQLSASNNHFDSLALQSAFIASQQPFELIELENNKFTFDDLRPNLMAIKFTGNPSALKYAPQDSIFQTVIYNKIVGDNLTIDLGIDSGEGQNTYNWTRNGTPFQSNLGNNKLVLNNLQIGDTGEYRVQVTNSNMATNLLTLKGRPIFLNVTSANDCLGRDSLALRKLYGSANGSAWTTPWNLNQPMNTWAGVDVSPLGCVTELNLTSRGLDGTIPVEIGNLLELVGLYMDNNNLTGSIPETIGNLTKLGELNLSENALSGNIPISLGNFANMYYLALQNNQLSGNIPDTLSNLTLLTDLSLATNQLDGPIPSKLSKLTNLVNLYLYENNLTGGIPKELGGLLNLEELNIADNPLLGGGLPTELGQCTKMKRLFAANCSLSGNVPTFPWNDLERFMINNNNLSNLASQQICNSIKVDENKFTFEDILTNITQTSYTYSPQDSVFSDTIITRSTGQSLTIDLGFDAAVGNSRYEWYKNGTFYDAIIGSNKLTFPNLIVNDAGVYHCQVTNTTAPNLVLYSRSITLQLGCTPAQTNITKSLCPGSSFFFNNQTITVAGTYRDTLVSTTGCDSIVILDLSLLPQPNVNLGSDTTICAGTNLILNAGNFPVISWSNNSSSAAITVFSNGLYAVTVTNANGCSDTDSLSLTVAPPLLATAGQDGTLNCVQSTYTLNGSVASGGGNIPVFTWITVGGAFSGPTNTAVATATTDGLYILTVQNINTGCSAKDSVTITADLDAPTDAQIVTTPACAGQSNGLISINNVTGGTAPFSYSLNNGTFQMGNSFSNLPPGNYSISVKGSNGCLFTINRTINTSPVNVSLSSKSICPGTSTMLSPIGTFQSYLWSTGATISSIEVLQAGTYTVTASASNGCTGTASAQISFHPEVKSIISAVDTLTCTKDQVMLNSGASLGNVFNWSTSNGQIISNNSASSITVDEGGIYTLIVRDNSTNCADTSSIEVIKTGESLGNLLIEPTKPSCSLETNGAIMVTSVSKGSTPFQYSLNNGAWQSAALFENLSSGTYSLSVLASDGCTKEQVVNLPEPMTLSVGINQPASVEKSGDDVNLSVQIMGSQGQVSYGWSGDNLDCTDCANPTATPIYSTTYHLTIADANGCTASDSVFVEVLSTVPPDILTPNDDGLNDVLEFSEIEKSPAKELNNIIIFNRWGQTVFTAQPYQNNWEGSTQNGNPLPEGTYYYVLYLKDAIKNVIYGNVLIIRN